MMKVVRLRKVSTSMVISVPVGILKELGWREGELIFLRTVDKALFAESEHEVCETPRKSRKQEEAST